MRASHDSDTLPTSPRKSDDLTDLVVRFRLDVELGSGGICSSPCVVFVAHSCAECDTVVGEFFELALEHGIYGCGHGAVEMSLTLSGRQQRQSPGSSRGLEE
jgi:hypothetical protein